MTQPIKTPIVYYGGKTSMIQHLLDLVPEHDIYTEVFFGGGTLFFAKRPAKNETINDRLDVVVNFYRVLKHNFGPLKKLIDSSLISRAMHREALNLIRLHRTGMSVDKVHLAWAFWMCTNFSFSNKLGSGYKYCNDISVCVPDTLATKKEAFNSMLVKRIEHAYIEHDEALKILESRNTTKAFHYLDPPYPGADNGHYAGYTWEDYTALLTFLGTRCKGKFLLSNYNSDLLDDFVKRHGWNKKEITSKIGGKKNLDARYKNGGSGRAVANRTYRTEVLVYNYSTPCGTMDLFTSRNEKGGQLNPLEK